MDPRNGEILALTSKPDFDLNNPRGVPPGKDKATWTGNSTEDVQYLLSDPGRVRAQAYDVVLNGIELGSGSMRIYQKDVQQKMFEALGFSEEKIAERFGFLVNAFRYGTPPHGGFAFGLDRLVMQMLGAESLREVTAFPKTKDAVCLMTNAPDTVDDEQLSVLGISLGQGSAGETRNAGNQKAAGKDIDVDKVANLSKLALSAEEKASMRKELGAIIDFANQLGEIDTENVPITAHVVPMQNVFRQDVAGGSFERGSLLENTPSKEDGYIFVPKVVE
jgi:aspartyl-tRNA synthetase